MRCRIRSHSNGFSLIELLAVVVILGIIAALVIPRITISSDTAKQRVDAFNTATINAAVERFYINTGEWPKTNLNDIETDLNYFPDGIPLNPVDGKKYKLDSQTDRGKM